MERPSRTSGIGGGVDLADVQGRDVVSADAVRVGQVVDLVEDGRFLEVELVPTLTGSPHPNDTLNPRTSRLDDPDPTVAETRISGHYNPGARQHAGAMPGAVPKDRPRDPEPEEIAAGHGRRVWIPAGHVRLREGEDQVFLETLRSQEVADLPRRTPSR